MFKIPTGNPFSRQTTVVGILIQDELLFERRNKCTYMYTVDIFLYSSLYIYISTRVMDLRAYCVDLYKFL